MDDPALPTRIQVEVTGACNLRCRMCLVAYRPPLAPRRASMALADLCRILDELPDLSELTLQGLGEPLLAPDLFAMIAEGKRRRLRVGFNTNATLLTDECSERLIELGLDWLHVSIDGATAETFAAIRRGGRLDVVVANLSRLVERRRGAGRTGPRIQVNTVLMRRNVTELEAIVALAAEIGVDRMWIQSLSHDFRDVHGTHDYAAIEAFTNDEHLDDAVAAEAFEAAAAAGRRHGIEVRIPGRPHESAVSARPCDWPWDSAYVTHDGTVQPCCMVMGSARATLGSTHEESFRAIWTGDRYRDFRERLLSSSPPDVCAGCALYQKRF